MSELKYKTLILCSRGVSHQQRHLISELSRLLPNSQKESKVDRKKNPGVIQELIEKYACTQVLYLENKGKIAVMWMGKYPHGPSIKFLLQNLWTSEELKLDGNCSKRARHVLSFDESFEESALMKVVREVLMQTFAVPENFEKIQGVVDSIMSFAQLDNKIFFRNYEIKSQTETAEIGPRFVLTPVKLFSGFMQGEVLYKNGKYLGRKKSEKPPKRFTKSISHITN